MNRKQRNYKQYGCLATIGWVLVACLILVMFPNWDNMKASEYGDLFAGLSAPLAFLWLVIAVLIQSEELSQQRKELRAQRQELQLTREVLNAQRVEAERQAQFIEQQAVVSARSNYKPELRQMMIELDVELIRFFVDAYPLVDLIHASLPADDQTPALLANNRFRALTPLMQCQELWRVVEVANMRLHPVIFSNDRRFELLLPNQLKAARGLIEAFGRRYVEISLAAGTNACRQFLLDYRQLLETLKAATKAGDT